MYICLCKGITEDQIQQAVKNGADYRSLREEMGLGTECGSCGSCAKSLVKATAKQVNCSFYEASAA